MMSQFSSSSSGISLQPLSAGFALNQRKSGKQASEFARKGLDKKIQEKTRSMFETQGWLKRVSGSFTTRGVEMSYRECEGIVRSYSSPVLHKAANYAIKMFATLLFKNCSTQYVRSNEIKKVYDSILPPVVRYASKSFKSFAPEFDRHFQKENLERGRSCLGGVRFVSHLEWTENPKSQKPSRQERWREFVKNNFREAGSKSVSAAEDANVYERFSGPVNTEKMETIIIDEGIWWFAYFTLCILTYMCRIRISFGLAFGKFIGRY